MLMTSLISKHSELDVSLPHITDQHLVTRLINEEETLKIHHKEPIPWKQALTSNGA